VSSAGDFEDSIPDPEGLYRKVAASLSDTRIKCAMAARIWATEFTKLLCSSLVRFENDLKADLADRQAPSPQFIAEIESRCQEMKQYIAYILHQALTSFFPFPFKRFMRPAWRVAVFEPRRGREVGLEFHLADAKEHEANWGLFPIAGYPLDAFSICSKNVGKCRGFKIEDTAKPGIVVHAFLSKSAVYAENATDSQYYKQVSLQGHNVGSIYVLPLRLPSAANSGSLDFGVLCIDAPLAGWWDMLQMNESRMRNLVSPFLRVLLLTSTLEHVFYAGIARDGRQARAELLHQEVMR